MRRTLRKVHLTTACSPRPTRPSSTPDPLPPIVLCWQDQTHVTFICGEGDLFSRCLHRCLDGGTSYQVVYRLKQRGLIMTDIGFLDPGARLHHPMHSPQRSVRTRPHSASLSSGRVRADRVDERLRRAFCQAAFQDGGIPSVSGALHTGRPATSLTSPRLQR